MRGARFGLLLTLITAVSGISAGAPVWAQTATTTVKHARVLRATLRNGLRVVIVRDPLARVATTELNYLVGSNEAPRGFPGTAHALEHMMFRGSPGLSRNQLAEISARMGGVFDADTTQTVTQFYFTVPSVDLDVALHVEALRMRGLDLGRQSWNHERGAIKQEVARDLSNPQYLLYTKLLANMFRGTPYAHDALGTRSSFNKTTVVRLRRFYRNWYAPNNAILVIAGDVRPQSTLRLTRTLFGDIPRKRLPDRPRFSLRPIRPHTFHMKTDRPYGLAVIAYRMPGYTSPDYAAAAILADVLNSRRGRLNALVPEGEALFAGFDAEAMQDVGMGYAIGAFPKDGNAKALLAAMKQRLLDTYKWGATRDLVAAARRQEIARIGRQENSIPGLADAWSRALAFQGLHSPQAMEAAFASVTLPEVDRAARQLLDPRHAISAIVAPQLSARPISHKGFGGRESITEVPTKPAKLPGWARRTLASPIDPKPSLKPIASTLPNGLHLIIQREDVSDTVSIYGSIRNQPVLEEPRGEEGVNAILARLFGYGGGGLGRLAYQRALDQIGAQEGGGTSFGIVVPSAHFQRAVQLLAANELKPELQSTAFKIVRSQLAKGLEGVLRSPDYLFGRALERALLPAGDPALREATPISVMGLSLGDVRRYYQKVFRPDLTTIVVIGDVDPLWARQVMERYFGDWTSRDPKPKLDLPKIPMNTASRTIVPDRTRLQDTVMLAENVGITRENPDHYALELGNEVLGKGFYAARFYRDLRARTGLVYSVDSDFDFGRTRSRYTVTYGCYPSNVSRARAIIRHDLEELRNHPLTRRTLDRAKAILLHQLPIASDSVSGIAGNWLFYSQHDLPLDQGAIAARRYAALTASDVHNAFRKWVHPQRLAEVVLGPTPH